MFQDVYRWAGDISNCNIAKQDLFCLTEYIELFNIDIFNRLKKEKYFAGDVAYINPHLSKLLIDLEIIPCLPFKRPMIKKGYFKKYEYPYDEHNDIYITKDVHLKKSIQR